MKQIGEELVADISEDLTESVVAVLDTNVASLPRRISAVEVLLKTEQDEMLLTTFDSVAEALSQLANYVVDRSDIGDIQP